MFSLQSRHIFLDFRLTESWGESKKDSKGEVDMSKEGRGRGGGGVEKHCILSIFHSMLLSIFYSIDLVTNTAAILN